MDQLQVATCGCGIIRAVAPAPVSIPIIVRISCPICGTDAVTFNEGGEVMLGTETAERTV